MENTRMPNNGHEKNGEYILLGYDEHDNTVFATIHSTDRDVEEAAKHALTLEMADRVEIYRATPVNVRIENRAVPEWHVKLL